MGWFRRIFNPVSLSLEDELSVAMERVKQQADLAAHWEEQYIKLKERTDSDHMLPGEILITDAEVALSEEVEHWKQRCEKLTVFANDTLGLLTNIQAQNIVYNNKLDALMNAVKEVCEYGCDTSRR